MGKHSGLYRRILSAWRRFEMAEPDISTERLYAMVMDACGCDYDQVTDALVWDHEANQ